MYKKRGLWHNLLSAILAAPFVAFGGVTIIIFIGGIDDIMQKKYLDTGKWWIILIYAFILSLAFYLWEVKIIFDIKKRE